MKRWCAEPIRSSASNRAKPLLCASRASCNRCSAGSRRDRAPQEGNLGGDLQWIEPFAGGRGFQSRPPTKAESCRVVLRPRRQGSAAKCFSSDAVPGAGERRRPCEIARQPSARRLQGKSASLARVARQDRLNRARAAISTGAGGVMRSDDFKEGSPSAPAVISTSRANEFRWPSATLAKQARPATASDRRRTTKAAWAWGSGSPTNLGHAGRRGDEFSGRKMARFDAVATVIVRSQPSDACPSLRLERLTSLAISCHICRQHG